MRPQSAREPAEEEPTARRWRYYYTSNGLWEEYSYDASGERVARKTDLAFVGTPSSDLLFFPIDPCRLLDTRNPNGPWGGPALNGQTERTFTARGQCGIPTTAKSLAANVTVVAPAYSGSLRAYPSGLYFVPSIISNAFNAGNVRAVQGHVGIDGTGTDAGKFRLFADVPSGSTAHAIVDLFGYFAPNPSSPIPSRRSWFVTLRDEGSRLLTDYRYDWRTDLGTSVTSLLKDYVYLGNLLVATNTTTASDGKPLGWVYNSSDHLGSPRMWTDASRVTLATFRYRAFGLPMNSLQVPGQGPDFAGMEKDASSGHHFDHARFYGNWFARFNSPDKLGGRIRDPQSWNRYSYSRNNPLKYIDPNGLEAFVFIVAPAYSDAKTAFGHAGMYVTSSAGSAGVSNGGAAGFDRGIRGFLDYYTSNGRQVSMYRLKTNDEQDVKMVKFIKSTGGNEGLKQEDLGKDFAQRNCTTACANVIREGGIIGAGEDQTPGRQLGIDRPGALQTDLESGDLRKHVAGKAVVEPPPPPPSPPCGVQLPCLPPIL